MPLSIPILACVKNSDGPLRPRKRAGIEDEGEDDYEFRMRDGSFCNMLLIPRTFQQETLTMDRHIARDASPRNPAGRLQTRLAGQSGFVQGRHGVLGVEIAGDLKGLRAFGGSVALHAIDF